jgi:flagellar hook-length control protein FliK
VPAATPAPTAPSGHGGDGAANQQSFTAPQQAVPHPAPATVHQTAVEPAAPAAPQADAPQADATAGLHQSSQTVDPAPVTPAAAAPPPPTLAGEIPLVVGSRLAHLATVARAVVQTSARTGITSARIDLRPPELGHVEIRLRYGADGVTATVTASSQAAADALGSSAGDLRRALEAQGLTVLALDVGHAGAGDRRRPEGDGRPQPGTGASTALDEGVDGEETTITTTRIPAAGSSVDVLA